MKFKYLLLIILAIIALHLIIVWLFMRGGESRTPAAPQDSSQQSIAESIAAAKAAAAKTAETASGTFAGASAPAARLTSAAENAKNGIQAASSVPLKKTPRVHAAYRYDYAVSGNIPELPASAHATSGILVDADTGTVLWAKNPERAFPIASMTKVMTLFLANEDIESGRIRLDTQVKVTPAAAKIGGSQVWLDPKETFSIQDLLLAVSIKSANDAAYQVAEFLGDGDPLSFVNRMNRRASELGMKNTHYYNPHGLPGANSREDNVSSPADMARLAEYFLEHPLLVKWASTLYADFREPGTKGHLQLKNHNNLLPGGRYATAGVDGLKTGFIARAGYCNTVTCLRNGKRLIAMVTGFPTAKERDIFLRQLLNWGYPRTEDPAAALAETRRKAAEPRTTVKSTKKSKSVKKRTSR